jgi:hypothetical protein
MSDIAENFSPISEYPTNFLPLSPISDTPIEAQSDIAHHGYRTKCPPMLLEYKIPTGTRRIVDCIATLCLSGTGTVPGTVQYCTP